MLSNDILEEGEALGRFIDDFQPHGRTEVCVYLLSNIYSSSLKNGMTVEQ